MDLVIGIGVMLMLSAAMFGIGWRIARSGRRFAIWSAGIIAVISLGFFLRFLWDNILLARLLPWSNLIVLGNWQPPIMAMLAGLVAGSQRVPGWRRALLASAVCGASIWRAYGPLLVAPPETRRAYWSDGVCLQSTDATCSPAAAATLLRTVGIDASEREMAGLCLTTPRGTAMHGLYRGLRLKTENTPYRVRVIHSDLKTLRQQQRPMLITVGLRRGQGERVDPRYAQLWGWREGVNHTVVFIGFAPNHEVEIGDPSVGREHWTEEGLEVLWQRDAILLERRDEKVATP